MVQERLTKLNHEIPLDFPPNVLAEAAELEKRAAEGAADLGGLKPLAAWRTRCPSTGFQRHPRRNGRICAACRS